MLRYVIRARFLRDVITDSSVLTEKKKKTR